ncbi:MAG TPA: amidohydrolase family protein [Actinomycetota bacterium]|jgi:predicted amidohydrolase YtcJ|nr:amidohydrolase family protein [Actinomycetota bacterium]
MRTLYRSSLVRTLSFPATAEWVLVDGRHVERAGSGEPPHADRIVDLPGTTLTPGFVDAHVHLTGTGIHHRAPEIHQTSSATELLATLGRIAAARPGPVLVHGWDETKWSSRRLPAIEDLDRVVDRPLMAMRADGHVALANHAAIAAAGLDDVEGVERDADGSPTGRVSRRANTVLRAWIEQHLDPREVEQLQLEAASLAVARGITCVHEMSLPEDRGTRDLEILLGHRGRLPVDVVPYVGTTDVASVIALGVSTIGGDVSMDGSVGARTAWMRDPYADGSGTGTSYYADDAVAEFFHAGHLAGLQVAVHAIGDAAIHQVVDAWERVYASLDSRGRRHFRARRHRIEHFELVDPRTIERAAALGLAVSVQPGFDAEWGHPGGLYELALGEERAARMNPFRSIVGRGIEVGAGSDSPVTPLDPLVGVAALQDHHDPTESMSRDEAVRLFTVGSARLAHHDEKKGTLAHGAHADLVAWDADPFRSEDLGGVRPVLTVSLGREVFAA